jgi:hypothetical protein
MPVALPPHDRALDVAVRHGPAVARRLGDVVISAFATTATLSAAEVNIVPTRPAAARMQ